MLHLQVVLVKPEPGARKRGTQFLDLTVSSSASQGKDQHAEQANQDRTEHTSPAFGTGHAADRCACSCCAEFARLRLDCDHALVGQMSETGTARRRFSSVLVVCVVHSRP